MQALVRVLVLVRVWVLMWVLVAPEMHCERYCRECYSRILHPARLRGQQPTQLLNN